MARTSSGKHCLSNRLGPAKATTSVVARGKSQSVRVRLIRRANRLRRRRGSRRAHQSQATSVHLLRDRSTTYCRASRGPKTRSRVNVRTSSSWGGGKGKRHSSNRKGRQASLKSTETRHPQHHNRNGKPSQGLTQECVINVLAGRPLPPKQSSTTSKPRNYQQKRRARARIGGAKKATHGGQLRYRNATSS